MLAYIKDTESSTVQNMWRDYVKNVYKNGVGGDQERQLKDAFVAGVFVTLQVLRTSSYNLSEDESLKFFEKLEGDCIDHVVETTGIDPRMFKDSPNRSTIN